MIVVFLFADEEEGYIPAPEPEQGMQDKLVSAWDTLQVTLTLQHATTPFISSLWNIIL